MDAQGKLGCSIIAGGAVGYVVGALWAGRNSMRQSFRTDLDMEMYIGGVTGAVLGSCWILTLPALIAHLLLRTLCKRLFRRE